MGRGGPREDRDRSSNLNNNPGAPQGQSSSDFAVGIDTWNPNSSGGSGAGGGATSQMGSGGSQQQQVEGGSQGPQGQNQQMLSEGGEVRRRGPRGSNKDAFDNAGNLSISGNRQMDCLFSTNGFIYFP